MGQKKEVAKDLLLGGRGEYCFNCRHFCIGNGEDMPDYCSERFRDTKAHWSCHGHWAAGDGRRTGLRFEGREVGRVKGKHR